MSVKHKPILYKSCLTQVKDIDEKGFVMFHASVFNTPDRVMDIVERGAYKKTISENFKEIQHYKNHDYSLMPGVIHSLTEDDYGLLVRSKLILDTQVGRETYAEYKAMAEAGKSMGHSIGYVTIKEDKGADGYMHLKELMLRETSSLTVRAAHPDALTLDIKSLNEMDFNELVKEENFYKSLLNCEFADVKLEQLELIKNHITALIKKIQPDTTTEGKNEPLMSKEEMLKLLL